MEYKQNGKVKRNVVMKKIKLVFFPFPGFYYNYSSKMSLPVSRNTKEILGHFKLNINFHYTSKTNEEKKARKEKKEKKKG
jgi:hypothetical protein